MATGLGVGCMVALKLAHIAHLARWLGGLGVVSHSGGPSPVNLFQFFKVFPNCIPLINHEKYIKCTFRVLKNSKLCEVVDKFKRNNFTFGKDFKFLTKFELK
jgi:hypothetical protein